MKDKITLGIPIYNAKELLERTILSVLNQTYPNIEFLFIDDKGNSMEVVHRIISTHPRGKEVRIIDQKYNQGIAAARNAILDNATGEFLFTMDCDDVIIPECIEILYKKMQEHPVDFVAASFVCVDMEGKEYPGCQYEDTLIEGEDYPVAQYRYRYGRNLFVATWNKLYRLDFLKKNNIRCQLGHFNEDPWFTYQVIIKAHSCRLLPDCTLQYTFNPLSVSGIAASAGYSEVISRQFIEVQRLKCDYIRFLSGEIFYRSLLTDIMEMSIYHSYRIGMSPQLPVILRQQLLQQMLDAKFTTPTSYYKGERTSKYLLLRIVFSFPLKWRVTLINVAVKLRIKEIIRRWIHF